MSRATKIRLLVAVLSSFLTVVCVAQSETVKFIDARCPATFQLPKSWTVSVNPHVDIWTADYSGKEVVCTIGLKPRGWSVEREADKTGLLPAFPVGIAIVKGPFTKVAHRAGFTRFEADAYGGDIPPRLLAARKSGWLISVRQGEDPAEAFANFCCQGVIGDTRGNTSAADGSKATYTATIAVVNNHKGYTAIIEGDNAERFSAVVSQIAKSLSITYR